MENFVSRLRSIWDGLSSLQKRLVTAAILAPLAIAVIAKGGWLFLLVAVAAALVSYREWLGLVQTEWKPHLEYTAYATIAATLIVGSWSGPSTAILIFAVGFIAVCIQAHMHVDTGKKEAPPWICAGLIYVALPFFCLLWLRSRGHHFVPQHGWAPLMMIVISVWMTDSCAYFAGRRFKGPKLAPHISPNKTWSGLIGGVVGSAVSVAIMAYIWEFPNWPLFIIMGAVLAVAAQAGDLLESYVKRRAGVKDSGTLIPGHGGMLDRIDGMMTAVPLFTLFMWVLTLN